MKIINVRELREQMPRLEETLARESELLLVSSGRPVARILPVAPQQKVQSLAWLRQQMTASPTSSAELLREGRDGR